MDVIRLCLLVMALFFSLLVGLTKSSATNTSSQTNENLNSELLGGKNQCSGYELIPGLSTMEHGIDFSSYTAFPKDGNFMAKKHQIFKFTCENANKWEDTNYYLPEQLEDPEVLSSQCTTEDSFYSEKMNKIQNSATASFSIEGVIEEGFTAGLSTTISDFEDEYYSSRTCVYQIRTIATLATYYMNENKLAGIVTDDFKKNLTDLPDEYQSNPKKYIEFIEKYGSHYYDKATTGGRIYQSIKINEDYSFYESINKIRVNAEAIFVGNYSANAGVSGSSGVVDEKFSANYHAQQLHFGGHISNGFDFEKWQDQLFKFPWIVSANLKPIEKLIEKLDGKKAVEVGLARRVYNLINLRKVKERKAAKTLKHFRDFSANVLYIMDANQLEVDTVPYWDILDLKPVDDLEYGISVLETAYVGLIKLYDNMATMHAAKLLSDEIANYIVDKSAAMGFFCRISPVCTRFLSVILKFNGLVKRLEECDLSNADQMLDELTEFKNKNIIIYPKDRSCCDDPIP